MKGSKWLALALALMVALPWAGASAAPKYTFRYTLDEAGYATITGSEYNGNVSLNVVIPARIDGHPVVSVGMLTASEFVRALVVPKGVTSLGPKCLWGMANLQSVSLPSTLVTVGDEAFRDCVKLRSVTFNGRLDRLGDDAFSGCKALARVVFKKGVRELGSGCFFGAQLTSVSLGSYCQVIGPSAFAWNSKLKSIKLPGTIDTIGGLAFDGTGLNAFRLPPKLTSLGAMALQHTPVQSVDGLSELRHIPMGLLASCPAIKAADLSGAVTIEEQALYRCAALREVTLGQRLESLGKEAFAYSGLAAVDLPASLSQIGEECFAGCHNLRKARIAPGAAAPLPGNLFWGCTALERVVIPPSVTQIAPDAFANVPANMVIEGVPGSAAHAYAVAHALAFQPMVEAQSVKLSKATVTLKRGKALTLKAAVLPADASYAPVWSSSDPAVAQVNGAGKVVALKKGKATITARAGDGAVAQCVITVKS